MRDRRFVTVHRGGSLSQEHHRLLIRWAYICAAHVLPRFRHSKIDERLNDALQAAKAWERGETSVGEARKASLKAIAAANENANPASIAVARSVGHAVAAAHMADHSIRAAEYALKAIELSGKSVDAERKWQDEQLPLSVKHLILSVRHEKPDKENMPKPKPRNRLTYSQIITRLKSLGDPKAVAGMARYGIRTDKALGVSLPKLRALAKEIGHDHALAQKLWASRIHEARLLAPMIDESGQLTEAQMERRVKAFDSWDVCDQCCSNLFDATPFAYSKAIEWSKRKEEFVKRAGFVLMACLAVHDKRAPDEKFIRFLPHIKRQATDERNFVKKAVNWALRQIGKRSRALNKLAIETAREIRALDSSTAKWIASDALRELTSAAVQKRLREK